VQEAMMALASTVRRRFMGGLLDVPCGSWFVAAVQV
jgi:hypothetical protein